MREATTLLGIVGLALALAACAGSRGTAPATPATPAASAESEPAPRLRNPELPAEARPRPRPSFDARRFVGLDTAGVEAQLGAPSLRQQEVFAEVWQYVSGPCVLHLYFYRPKGGAADAPLKVEQALVETRPGPWGDNLNPQGICSLEFSGRQPQKLQPQKPQTQPNKPGLPSKKTIVPRPRQ